MTKVYEKLGSFLVIVINGVYMVFVWSKLLEWILVPIFSIKQLSMIELYCLFIVYASVQGINRNTENDKLTFTSRIVSSLIHSNLALVFGYCASRFL